MSFGVNLLVSSLLGFLSGLGVGGGSLLMIWLTFFAGIEYAQAKLINLLFFLPSAAVSCYGSLRKKQIPLKRIFPAILSGVLSAFLFSQISSDWDTAFLKKLFGVLLLVTAAREFFFPPAKEQETHL